MTDFRINWLLEIIALVGNALLGWSEKFQSMEAFGSLSCKLHSSMRLSPFRMYRVFRDVIVEAVEVTIDKSSRLWNNFLQQLCGEIFFWIFRVQCQVVTVRARTVQIIELYA